MSNSFISKKETRLTIPSFSDRERSLKGSHPYLTMVEIKRAQHIYSGPGTGINTDIPGTGNTKDRPGAGNNTDLGLVILQTHNLILIIHTRRCKEIITSWAN